MILTQDRVGNRIDLEDNGAVFLHLKNKTPSRKLGDIHSGNLYVVRKPAQHIFRKFNAYGFNLTLIKILKPDAQIVVRQYGDATSPDLLPGSEQKNMDFPLRTLTSVPLGNL